MKKQISFSQIGNELIHELRNNINNSEGPVDIANHFSYSACKLLKSVFSDDSLQINQESVIFNPQAKNYFTLDGVLLQNSSFAEIWQNSDLSNVIEKFAESSYHRYVHHNKHQEKTNKKIRK